MNWIERWRGLAWDPPGHAGWLFIILAVAAVAYAAFVYRRTDAPLKPALRALLAGLRAMALLTLIAILCRPVVSLAVPGRRRPRRAVAPRPQRELDALPARGPRRRETRNSAARLPRCGGSWRANTR